MAPFPNAQSSKCTRIRRRPRRPLAVQEAAASSGGRRGGGGRGRSLKRAAAPRSCSKWAGWPQPKQSADIAKRPATRPDTANSRAPQAVWQKKRAKPRRSRIAAAPFLPWRVPDQGKEGEHAGESALGGSNTLGSRLVRVGQLVRRPSLVPGLRLGVDLQQVGHVLALWPRRGSAGRAGTAAAHRPCWCRR